MVAHDTNGSDPRCSTRKHSEFPTICVNLMTENINTVVITAHFEISMVGSKPTVQNLDDIDVPLAEKKTSWCLVSPITGITVDRNAKVVFIHIACPVSTLQVV